MHSWGRLSAAKPTPNDLSDRAWGRRGACHRAARLRADPLASSHAALAAVHSAPVHSITSSAATRRVWGMVMPSTLAVLRLITNSN
jgi:hypothetical protein